ncbi:MAG: phosphotransferase family protein [Phycisphaerales bacterium]
MTSQASIPAELAGSDLGRALQPAIERACRGKLSHIRWFNADWQRGGAATGFATAEVMSDSVEGWESKREVVIKSPIGWREYRTLRDLGMTSAPTPRVVMMGTELDSYDFAWAVMERLPGSPIVTRLESDPGGVFEELCDATARFYRACAECWGAPERPSARFDWHALLRQAIGSLEDNPTVGEHDRWVRAIDRADALVDRIVPRWRARSVDTWCHGDLHPGNAMVRGAGSAWGEAGVVLIDFAEVHAGHWVEDAVYMERLLWARGSILRDASPVARLGAARERWGLPVGEDYLELADIRRALKAASAPAFLHLDGHPAYLGAALSVLESSLDRLGG